MRLLQEDDMQQVHEELAEDQEDHPPCHMQGLLVESCKEEDLQVQQREAGPQGHGKGEILSGPGAVAEWRS